MRYILWLITLLLLFGSAGFCEEESWTGSGELAYSYVYARHRVGYLLRREHWQCVQAFTVGIHGEQEHSVWERNGEKLQLMIWRIDSGRTGVSYHTDKNSIVRGLVTP